MDEPLSALSDSASMPDTASWPNTGPTVGPAASIVEPGASSDLPGLPGTASIPDTAPIDQPAPSSHPASIPNTASIPDTAPIVEPAPRAEHPIKLNKVLAVVSWRDAAGKPHCLEGLRFTILHAAGGATDATLNLYATGRIRKAPAKPDLLLLIPPEHIQALRCVEDHDGDAESDEEAQRQQAAAKFSMPAHTLRFQMRQRLAFVVPPNYAFASFREASQRLWRSIKTFAQETTCFYVHFPAATVPRYHLVSFCSAASGGQLTQPVRDLRRLYGGRGGKVVDLDETDSDEPDAVTVAPPAYVESDSANSPTAPPFCLSPHREASRLRKRRRRNSSPDVDDREGAKGKGKESCAPSPSNAMLAEILETVRRMETRLDRLEDEQARVADDFLEALEDHMKPMLEPVRDDMEYYVLTQMVENDESMRSVATEVVQEALGDGLEEVVNQYFVDHGYDAIDEAVEEAVGRVLDQRIRQGIQEALRTQRFVGSFTVDSQD